MRVLLIMAQITLKQALDIIDSGKAFDIEYVACDKERGTGGELKAYTNVVKSSVMFKPRDTANKSKVLVKRAMVNHGANSTFNIYVPQGDRKDKIRKVHTRLITKINGLEVL